MDYLESLWEWGKSKWWVVLGMCLTIGMVIGGLIYWRRRKLRGMLPPEKLPSYLQAIQDLEELNKKQLWQKGKIKHYYSDLSDIMRVYIEDRYQINAPEQTTDEILHNLRFVQMDKETKNALKQLFRLADLVKFAKQNPSPIENEASMRHALNFIENTYSRTEVSDDKENDNEQPNIVV